jgi:hypothetical protein
MKEDLSANYIVVNDIDASGTVNWNEITSDEFTSYSVNGDTIQLNLVASEGTINVVDSTGTDVAFTSNTNNDAITIDDTAIDTRQDLTISYDLETPINQGFDPVGTYDYEQANSEFAGSFDGQNHTIRNLSINRLDDNNVGLFGAIDSSAEVENIGILYADINSYKSFVGSLVGLNSGTVSNSYSTGNVTGESYFVGGLIGYNRDGTVSNSYSTGNVTGESFDVGGLVGENYGNISNSYSTGNVTGESYNVGGLVGDNYKGNISNSYSTGNVTGEEEVGGLVGQNDNTVSNSYWNSDSTITENSTDVSTDNTTSGVPLTTSEMQGSSAEGNMDEFDFTSTWSTVEGDYPELQG